MNMYLCSFILILFNTHLKARDTKMREPDKKQDE